MFRGVTLVYLALGAAALAVGAVVARRTYPDLRDTDLADPDNPLLTLDAAVAAQTAAAAAKTLVATYPWNVARLVLTGAQLGVGFSVAALLWVARGWRSGWMWAWAALGALWIGALALARALAASVSTVGQLAAWSGDTPTPLPGTATQRTRALLWLPLAVEAPSLLLAVAFLLSPASRAT